MRLVLAGLITIVALAESGSVFAMPPDVTKGFSAAYQACITYGETHDTTAIPAAECNAREFRSQDARLNASYRKVVARLSPARKADIRADERNWIIARDQRCGKRVDSQDRQECAIDETIRRILYLRHYR